MQKDSPTEHIDDITKEPITEESGRTIPFSFDGNDYEITLTNRHAEALRETFSKYIAAARRAHKS
ncbi:Lsr2 family protein (plasmid) [Curtobacterium flaccumfaciens]|uniref:Lsr2 family protein n=1 Tax=Curtobacterium poinsettiae TaxID=159612 RepID=A0A9Q9T4Z6_9MICO|nr:histone-like nucleoid-structuring protein Lsr2 [Curtobacterium flaccumfaciens]MBT1620548.1 Lsr2 family protein [Curtobacterium flaccumfaciens pv. poinsettiae]MCS6563579.1 Lsr2 family protein [Curtobacterium flaccumfaciens pv. poinsettiae]MCU0154516.1 Lsr2 family protein [Curtobacterium flaccumfaciens pv. poinsettiae]UXN16947.1 Lsr2 family protein [Curtobacterium flaccumfaciens pv. poinsettiae]UXN27203.1 Lsr2 family protein [Curtobacterium flaccumfaciens]